MSTSFASQALEKKRAHRGSLAIQRLVEKSPGFGSLALWLKHTDTQEDIALSWTDGKAVYYPAHFEKLSLEEQVGVSAHEVMHVAFRHPQRGAALRRQIQDFKHDLYNLAADAIINQSLASFSWMRLPGSPPMLVEMLKEVFNLDMPADQALASFSVETLYKLLDEQADLQSTLPKFDLSGANGKAGTRQRAQDYARKKGFTGDMELPAGSDPVKDAEETREWNQRLTRARAGDRTRGILRQTLADLPKTKTPWQHILRSKLMRALQPETETTWNRPSRRFLALGGPKGALSDMPYEPGIGYDKPAMKLAVMVDTSGSIDDTMLNRFAAEICSIQMQTGAHIHVIVCDMVVHGQWELPPEPGRRNLGKDIEFKGQGGTDFGPAIAAANELGCAMGVYLTDLQGPARVKPNFPIIWAVPEAWGQGVSAPFGQLVLID